MCITKEGGGEGDLGGSTPRLRCGKKNTQKSPVSWENTSIWFPVPLLALSLQRNALRHAPGSCTHREGLGDLVVPLAPLG